MGFLNKLFDTVSQVKEIADDIQKVVKESGIVECTDRTAGASAAASADRTAGGSTAQNVGITAGNVILQMPQGIQAREVADGCFYDNDAEGNEYRVTTRMMVDKRFHAFRSGAGEVDSSFSYSPEIEDDDACAEWDSGIPYLMIGYESAQAEIVNKYLKGNPLPAGATVAKVTGKDTVLYRTTSDIRGVHYVAYHFYRGFDKETLYQIEVSYPVSCIGKPEEKICLDALDLLALTYSEEPVRE